MQWNRDNSHIHYGVLTPKDKTTRGDLKKF